MKTHTEIMVLFTVGYAIFTVYVACYYNLFAQITVKNESKTLNVSLQTQETQITLLQNILQSC